MQISMKSKKNHLNYLTFEEKFIKKILSNIRYRAPLQLNQIYPPEFKTDGKITKKTLIYFLAFTFLEIASSVPIRGLGKIPME